MSSFIISKEDYVKAAGVVCGFKKVHRDFWLYSFELGRNMEEADIYNAFIECYELNVMSVLEQYRGDAPGADATDGAEYMDVFREYRDLSEQGYHQGKTKDILLELRQFFHSALYQTENRAASDRMSGFFYRIIDQIIPIAFYRDCNSWESLDLSGIVDESHRVYDLFEMCGL